MTSISDDVRAHPDAARFRAVADADTAHLGDLPERIARWIDIDVLIHYANGFAEAMLDDKNAPLIVDEVSELVAYSFARGFVLGAQFHAAGGHRDPHDDT